MAVGEFDEARRSRAARVLGNRTTVDEHATCERRAEWWWCAGDRVESVGELVQTAAWNAAQEPHRVRVVGLVQHLFRRALFDERTGIQHADTVTHRADHAEVVADEEHCGSGFGAKCAHEVEYFGLDGCVQSCRRFVEDEEARVGGKRHRDDHALGHATRELVWVALEHRFGIGDLYALQRGERQLARLVCGLAEEFVHLGDLLADANRRVQRRDRVLVHHRDRIGAQLANLVVADGGNVLALEVDRATGDRTVAREVAHRGKRCRRLAAARFADESVGLAGLDRQRDSTQHLTVDAAHAVCDSQVAKLQGRWGGHSSNASVTPSAMRLMPIARVAIAPAGKIVDHQVPLKMRL